MFISLFPKCTVRALLMVELRSILWNRQEAGQSFVRNQPKCVKEVGLPTIFKTIHSSESFFLLTQQRCWKDRILFIQFLESRKSSRTEKSSGKHYCMFLEVLLKSEYSLVQSQYFLQFSWTNCLHKLFSLDVSLLAYRKVLSAFFFVFSISFWFNLKNLTHWPTQTL